MNLRKRVREVRVGRDQGATGELRRGVGEGPSPAENLAQGQGRTGADPKRVRFVLYATRAR